MARLLADLLGDALARIENLILGVVHEVLQLILLRGLNPGIQLVQLALAQGYMRHDWGRLPIITSRSTLRDYARVVTRHSV